MMSKIISTITHPLLLMPPPASLVLALELGGARLPSSCPAPLPS
jgi:hypothetical protein